MKTYSRIFFAHNKSDSFFAKVDQGELGTVIPTCPVWLEQFCELVGKKKNRK